MKTLLLILTLVLLIALAPTAWAQKHKPYRDPLVQTQYDKFSDRTTVKTTGATMLNPDLFLTSHFSYSGSEPPEAVESFSILIVGSPNVWGGALTESHASFLLDGHQPSLSLLLSYSSTIRAQRLLFVSYAGTLDAEEFQELACADRVETRIGIREGEIPKRELIKLRALLVVAGRRCPSMSFSPSKQP